MLNADLSQYCRNIEDHLKKTSSIGVVLLNESLHIREYNPGFIELFSHAQNLADVPLANLFELNDVEFHSGEEHKLTFSNLSGRKGVAHCRVIEGDNGLLLLFEKVLLSESRALQQIGAMNDEFINLQRELVKKNRNEVKLRQELDKRIADLEAALNRINKLEGIISICMHCKKIRNEHESWELMEKYVSEHSDALFSHGICPNCLDEHYPEISLKLSKKRPAGVTKVKQDTSGTIEQKSAEEALRESEEKHRILFRDSPDAHLIIVDGVFVDCNRATELMLRGDRSQIVGQSPDMLSPEFQPDGKRSSKSAPEKIREALISKINTFEWVHRRFDGTDFWVEVSIAATFLSGKPALFTIWRDITGRKLAEKALQENRSFLSEVIENNGALMYVKDRDGRYELVNRKWEKTTGLKRTFVIGRTDAELFPGDVGKAFRENDEEVMTSGESCETEEMLEDETGKRFFISIKLPLRDADNMVKGLCGMSTEITRRKQAESALAELTRTFESMSITDSLTGIANRRHFDTQLETEYARHVRSGGELSLIMLDIDHFKSFNDTYGHLKGDDCLRQISRVLAQCTARAADMAARYGGEEFVCILPETDRSGAVIIAEQIRRGIEALAIPHKGSGVADHITASLGVVTSECTMSGSPLNILDQTDELLYRAKSSGRNRIEIAASRVSLGAMEELRGNFVQLVWKDFFCSGNNLIDAQHQLLFQVSNELFDAIFSGSPLPDISAIIARLLADVKQHFQDEQMILEKAGFPGLQKHLEEHTRLLARGAELSEQFETSTLSVGDVFQFLAYDVVMNHMLGADREYFSHI